jgi:hypothetical protein
VTDAVDDEWFIGGVAHPVCGILRGDPVGQGVGRFDEQEFSVVVLDLEDYIWHKQQFQLGLSPEQPAQQHRWLTGTTDVTEFCGVTQLGKASAASMSKNSPSSSSIWTAASCHSLRETTSGTSSNSSSDSLQSSLRSSTAG